MSEIDVLDETTAAGALSGALADSTITEVKRIIEALRKRGFKIIAREPTDEMTRAGIGPFMAAHDPFFSKNEPTGPIFKTMWDAAS